MAGYMRSYLAELIGTFALILVGGGSIVANQVSHGGLGVTGIAFAHGLTIMAMAYAFGAISGGHFNPAVTTAMLVNRRIGPAKGVVYIVSQLLGAALAGLLLRAIYHGSPWVSASPFLGACDLDANVSFHTGVIIEAVLTFFLITVIYATAVDSRGSGITAPIAIGLTITLGILWAGPLTGAAINPARAFGPAVATGHWANHLVYWVGPLAGGTIAGLLYEYLFLQK
jgi:MIP family channel proteins